MLPSFLLMSNPTPLLSQDEAPTLPTLQKVGAAINAGKIKREGTCNRDWTLSVKRRLGELGKEHKWSVCTSSLLDFEPEWLFDQTWFWSPENRLRELGLVMESEWGSKDEVIYDFEKLLVARAPYKVMIFEADGGECEEIFNSLRAGIDSYRHLCKQEHYVLACWRGSGDGRFDIRSVSWTPGGEMRMYPLRDAMLPTSPE